MMMMTRALAIRRTLLALQLSSIALRALVTRLTAITRQLFTRQQEMELGGE